MTLVAFSRAVATCLDAAKELNAAGIEAEVINLRSLRPLDFDTVLESVKKTNHLVSVEHGWPQSGVGAEIVSRMVEGNKMLMDCFGFGDGFSSGFCSICRSRILLFGRATGSRDGRRHPNALRQDTGREFPATSERCRPGCEKDLERVNVFDCLERRTTNADTSETHKTKRHQSFLDLV